jgi:purine-binding chemotaxis protein CheW
MTETSNLIKPAAQKANSGKYITFVLGQESYGIPVLKVREIIRLVSITAVPQVPGHIRGVINLRGKMIPVVDLRAKFGLANAQDTERACIIVVQVLNATGVKIFIGLIVDEVEEVANITPADVEDTPDFGISFDTSYILGMAKIRGTVKTLLDVDRLLVDAAAAALQQTLSQ